MMSNCRDVDLQANQFAPAPCCAALEEVMLWRKPRSDRRIMQPSYSKMHAARTGRRRAISTKLGVIQLILLLGAGWIWFLFFMHHTKLPSSVALPENERHKVKEQENAENDRLERQQQAVKAGALAAGGGRQKVQQQGADGPLYCRLGLPVLSSSRSLISKAAEGRADAAADTDSSDDSTTDAEAAAGQQQGQQQAQQQQQQQHGHRLAVLIPYRQREQHLRSLLEHLVPYLRAQGRLFDVFVLEQADGLLFNRGALLNVAALLLEGSAYDYYVFQDVDTIPSPRGNIQYSYPAGDAPLHLTPNWIHPKSNYEDFFGGLLIVTPEQFRKVNGFGTQFWGWGREDDNLRERFKRAGLWPPEHPPAPHRGGKSFYFTHQKHSQAKELRGKVAEDGSTQFFQENPRLPYRGASIMSSQPQLLQDYSTGLTTTRFRVDSVQPVLDVAVKYTLTLHCDHDVTPWCDPSVHVQRAPAEIKQATAAHAIGGLMRRQQ